MKNKTKILSIHEAWELYKIIHPHFPENVEDMGIFEFIHSLIHDLKTKEIIRVVELLSTNKKIRIEKIERDNIIRILVSGFENNKIIQIKEFFSGLTNV